MKIVSRASRPGLLVGFLRILCNGLCTAQRFHTVKNMITHAVLDAQMNVTLSHVTMSVPGCPSVLFLPGDMLRYCHEKSFSTRLDHSGLSATRSIWNCGTALP